MVVRNSSPARHGFTLVEMLIVVTVISIMALIVFPRVSGATRKAKEATVKADLQTLRGAIAQFSADTGCYPTKLTDLVVTTAPLTGVDENGNSVAIPAGCYQGPYLLRQGGIGGEATGLPINPFTTLVGGTGSTGWTLDTNWVHHWSYSNGAVSAVTTGNTLDGVPFSSL